MCWNRLILSLLLSGIGLAVMTPCVYAEDAAGYKAQLQQIAATKFEGTAAQYKAFSQQIGDSLVHTADEMLTLPDLVPEDTRFALLMKYWGLTCQYGFDEEEWSRRIEALAAEIELIPEALDVYKKMMETLCFISMLQLDDDLQADRKGKLGLYRDRFFPFLKKYGTEVRYCGYVTSLINKYDSDGLFESVVSCVEELRPLLEKWEKIEHLSVNAEELYGIVRRIQLTGQKLEYQGISIDGKLIDIKDYRGKTVLLCMSDSFVKRELFKDLYESLHPHGLEMITYNFYASSPDEARKNAEKYGFVWSVIDEQAVKKSDLEDYCRSWGGMALILVDGDGTVIQSWRAGLCPAACQELKKLFPDHAEKITEIEMQLVREKEEIQEKRVEWEKQNQSDHPVYNELVVINRCMGYAHLFHNRNLANMSDNTVYPIMYQARLDLFHLLEPFDAFTLQQRCDLFHFKFEMLSQTARDKVKAQPEIPPEEIYEEFLQWLDQSKTQYDPKENVAFIHTLIEIGYHDFVFEDMLRYLENHAKSKQDYFLKVQDLLKEFITDGYGCNESESAYQYKVGIDVSRFERKLRKMDPHDNLKVTNRFYNEFIPLLHEKGVEKAKNELKSARYGYWAMSLLEKEFPFEYVLLNDEKRESLSLREKVVLIFFWRSDCLDCLHELQNVKNSYEDFKNEEFEVLVYCVDDDFEQIEAFLEKNEFPWTVVSHTKTKKAGIVNILEYDLTWDLPAMFLIDRNGNLFWYAVSYDMYDFVYKEKEKTGQELLICDRKSNASFSVRGVRKDDIFWLNRELEKVFAESSAESPAAH